MQRRWALSKLNADMAIAAATAKGWEEGLERTEMDIEKKTEWLREALWEVCNASMPRINGQPKRKGMYWWNQDIARQRAKCIRAQHCLTHYRRRNGNKAMETEELLLEEYKEARGVLRGMIRTAKNKAWKDLLEDLDKDPWGKPYLIVRKKLKSGGPSVAETLEPEILDKVVEKLFPEDEEAEVGTFPEEEEEGQETDWTEEAEILNSEMRAVARKMRAKKTAPGPDGIPGKVWGLALGALGGRLKDLMNQCLIEGKFPKQWKKAGMVLMKKEGKPDNFPSSYRPICLLDEVGKMYERILAGRIRKHLTTEGLDLFEHQYGFREGKSTIDAIRRVREVAQESADRGQVLMTVSLDISNAFNTLPWRRIKETLEYHRIPIYIQKVIKDYLKDRTIEYKGRYGKDYVRNMNRGVPQGSVLGPLLWNLGYNWVLRGALLPGLQLVCYADDTLVLASGRDWEEATRRAKIGSAMMIRRIRTLGLEVALQNTEVMYMAGAGGEKSPPQGYIDIEGERIKVGPNMKYLGLTLDRKWEWEEHFRRLAPKIRGAVNGLGRILPNLGGPKGKRRQLYMAVVTSIALYGAPIWAGELKGGSIRLLNELQRRFAIRVIRGYRTVAGDAAVMLAGTLPWEVLGRVYREMYEVRKQTQREGKKWTQKEKEKCRKELWTEARRKWAESLEIPKAGHRTVNAVRPVLQEWGDRKHGVLTYRVVQILTGHGCFGEYLHRIARREKTPGCHHCSETCDSANNTPWSFVKRGRKKGKLSEKQ